MDTKIVSVNPQNLLETARLAARVWQAGGLVAFPTETVYGLGANGLSAEAAGKIYAAKGRPSDNPLILHIADREQLFPLVKEVDERATRLMDAFWPGPLTLIFRRAGVVPAATAGGLDTIAVRMPSHPVAAALLKEAALPIAAPSANLSGRPSPTSVRHVIDDMNGRIELIIDGGDAGIGLESTIVDVSGEQPALLRPGFITPAMLESVVGPLEYDPAIYRPVGADVHPKAPGMKYRHYAPKADMWLVEGEEQRVIAYINARIAAQPQKRAGILATDETKDRYAGGLVLSLGKRADLSAVAHNLFRALRDFDDAGVDVIYAETFPDEAGGIAVMNRLRKSAGHQIVSV